MHRFFVPLAMRTRDGVTLTGGIAHQIARVLRLRPEEEIVLIPRDCVDAVEWRVRLETVEANAVRGSVIAERPGLAEPTCAVTLYTALLKGERFDWLLQKATELGVAAIQPILTERTVRRVGPEDGHARERWQRIVTEAAEQSGRSRVPALSPPQTLDALANARVPSLFVAHESVTAGTLGAMIPATATTVSVAIGPEGGFSDAEVGRLVATGTAQPVSLGWRILRAETAAITAVTIVMTATDNLTPPAERVWRAVRDI